MNVRIQVMATGRPITRYTRSRYPKPAAAIGQKPSVATEKNGHSTLKRQFEHRDLSANSRRTHLGP